MKHTEVYGLRNNGTKNEVKGTLATMKAGGEEGHEIHTSLEGNTPPPNEVGYGGFEVSPGGTEALERKSVAHPWTRELPVGVRGKSGINEDKAHTQTTERVTMSRTMTMTVATTTKPTTIIIISL